MLIEKELLQLASLYKNKAHELNSKFNSIEESQDLLNEISENLRIAQYFIDISNINKVKDFNTL